MPRLPSPLAAPTALRRTAGGRDLALFLDFDGTLVGFRPRPELPRLSAAGRRLICALTRRHFVAVVSGRDLPDIRRRIGLPGLWYAGCHGLEIAGPTRQFQPAAPWRAPIEEATRRLLALEKIGGVQVERKRFVVALHYRRVTDLTVLPEIEGELLRVMGEVGGLRLLRNQAVLELRPALDWHKGRAVEWLRAHAAPADHFPVCIGDDLTDEDAFAAVAADGAGILVARTPRATLARYRLTGPLQVQGWLRRLLN